MHAVILGPTYGWDEFLQQRRELGLDHHDEVWDGVLHVVPPAAFQHQRFIGDLLGILRTISKPEGLECVHEAGVFGNKEYTNFRVPDLIVAHPRDVSKRGIEQHAELVVEVLSPHDESRQKYGFYASLGIPEYWLVNPNTRESEIYVLREGVYMRQPEVDGTIDAPRFGLKLRVVDGPRLRITWADGSTEI